MKPLLVLLALMINQAQASCYYDSYGGYYCYSDPALWVLWVWLSFWIVIGFVYLFLCLSKKKSTLARIAMISQRASQAQQAQAQQQGQINIVQPGGVFVPTPELQQTTTEVIIARQ